MLGGETQVLAVVVQVLSVLLTHVSWGSTQTLGVPVQTWPGKTQVSPWPHFMLLLLHLTWAITQVP